MIFPLSPRERAGVRGNWAKHNSVAQLSTRGVTSPN